MANYYRSFAEELASYGLAAEMVHRQRDMYRAGSGKLYHSTNTCGRLRRATSVEQITIDPAGSADIQLCSVCNKELPSGLSQYKRAAHEVASLMRQVQEVASATGWQALGKAERLVDELEVLKAREIHRYWTTEITAAQLNAKQSVSDLRQACGDPAAVVDACATNMFPFEIADSHVDLLPLGSPERYNSQAHSHSRTVDRAWTAWSTAMRDGRAVEARQKAHKEVACEIGDSPLAFKQLPDKTRTPMSDHASLHDWLKAEWLMSRDAAVDSIVDTWDARLREKVREYALKPDQIVLYLVSGDGYGREMALTYVSTFSPVRATCRSGLLVAKVPAILHAYLGSSQGRRGLVGACPAEPNDDQSMLEVFATLYDPNNGAMADISTVAQLARVMVPSS